MAKKLLIVDDNKELRDMLKAYLEQDGFEVVTAGDGQEGLFVARYEKPDLIILDQMMPEMTGTEFLRAYSKEADNPVIMLTAKLEESDKVLGLELGADDYITKPFSMRELSARVRAVLRRSEKQNVEKDVYRYRDISLDRAGRMVTKGTESVDLTPTEFELLAAMMSAPGRAFSRMELLNQLQGVAFEGYERAIDVHIHNLRSKIESKDEADKKYIETVYGAGYRLAPEKRP